MAAVGDFYRVHSLTCKSVVLQLTIAIHIPQQQTVWQDHANFKEVTSKYLFSRMCRRVAVLLLLNNFSMGQFPQVLLAIAFNSILAAYLMIVTVTSTMQQCSLDISPELDGKSRIPGAKLGESMVLHGQLMEITAEFVTWPWPLSCEMPINS